MWWSKTHAAVEPDNADGGDDGPEFTSEDKVAVLRVDNIEYLVLSDQYAQLWLATVINNKLRITPAEVIE